MDQPQLVPERSIIGFSPHGVMPLALFCTTSPVFCILTTRLLQGSGPTGSAEGRCKGCNAPTGSGPALAVVAVVAVAAVAAVARPAFLVRRGADAS